jgi:EAL domain-containing protein (putative c-di-GMP-specific phosphodiesterase class I)
MKKFFTLATALIEIAHTLNLKAIAEGVETPEQLEFLRSLGCDGIQGYLFSPAVPVEAATKILQDQRPFPSIFNWHVNSTEQIQVRRIL